MTCVLINNTKPWVNKKSCKLRLHGNAPLLTSITRGGMIFLHGTFGTDEFMSTK